MYILLVLYLWRIFTTNRAHYRDEETEAQKGK